LGSAILFAKSSAMSRQVCMLVVLIWKKQSLIWLSNVKTQRDGGEIRM
jgi:hypothetical protein